MLEFEDIAGLPRKGLTARGISGKVAKMYGVRTEVNAETGEDDAYYYPLINTDSVVVGYQRKAAKEPGSRAKGDVSRVGETKGALPFGAHVAGRGGNMLVVTEGAEDCLAAVQMLQAKGKNYRVVASLGTDGWKRNVEYYESFQKVVIAFDQDEAGQTAAAEFAGALTSGKAHVMRWSGAPDPNELLLTDGGADVFLDALFQAKPHNSAGVVYGKEVWERMQNFVEPKGVPYPEDWEILRAKMGDIREAEITMFTGGSSTGKTAYTRAIKTHLLLNTGWRIGEVELEERGEKTWRGVMEAALGKKWADATKDERYYAWEQTYGSERIFTLDHRSQYGRGQSLIGKFKHLHYNMGCNVLFLDHVTLAVMEFGEGSGNQAQDQMMNEFLEFVETTGVHLFLVSHLRKSSGGSTSFEEGAVPSMDDLKGSGSLKQISFNIIGVSRNLQHEDDYERNVSQLHVLKCRETGKTGRADRLYWDDETRQLVPAMDPDEPDDNQDF